MTRGRVILVVLFIAAFILITSLRGLAGFYTDFLWFDSLGFASVWRTVLFSQVILVIVAGLVFFIACWVNLFIADRVAPLDRVPSPEDELLERYQALVGRRRTILRTSVSLVLAIFAGSTVSAQWENALLFLNRKDFGVADAQFGRDVGFYVFELPFISFLVSFAFASTLIITIVTAVAHYLNGGIRLQGDEGSRVTPQVKAHISLLLAVLAALRAVGYWYDRYELTLSTRGFVDGASFTDVEAQLPALNLMVMISVFSCALLVYNIWRRGFTWPVLAVGLWAFVAILALSVYPAAIQRFRVEPAESTREEPFIVRNIEATRLAMGLSEVREVAYLYESDLNQTDLDANTETVDNVRLLDPAIVGDTFQRLEGVRGFYRFRDVDVARYNVDGEPLQVVLSARELVSSELPNRSWESERIANTHGYGLAVAPANDVRDGQPIFITGGVPVRGDDALGIEQPRIYFGEEYSGYVVVGAERDEVDYVTEDNVQATFRYDGTAGVSASGLINRLAFALRFNDFNPLVSSQITSESKIILNRDIRARANEVAPFLDFDADPYPAVIDGQVKWILDAYTTTSRYPYAQRADNRQLPVRSGLRGNFNYVRNSVKVVIDAYDGDVTLYLVDESDPLAQAYRDIFPDLFEDEVPADLAEQFRYPEDLFRVQTNMWGRYRISAPSEFYDATGAWNVAQNPPAVVGGTDQAVTELDPTTGLARRTEERIAPQYLQLRLPGEEDSEYVLTRPFVPFSDDDSRRDLEGFMVARSDPEGFGELIVYDIAAASLPSGPAQFDADVRITPEISQEITLLNREGSQVVLGNLLLVPIADSILYVRPLYLQASGATSFPQLEKVIVGFGETIVMRDTFEQALAAAVAGAPAADPSPEAPDTPDAPDEPTPPTDLPDSATLVELLTRADALFDEAQAALAEGDLGGYQSRIEEAQALVERALGVQDPDGDGVSAPDDGTDA